MWSAEPFQSCDIVHNCGTLVVSGLFDVKPPTIVIPDGGATVFTAQNPLTVSATVTDDASGVGRVAFNNQTGGSAVSATQGANSVWSASVSLFPDQHNTITVAAFDQASPPNSVTSPTSFNVVLDTRSPVFAPVSLQTYVPETPGNINLSLNSSGIPITPAQINLTGAKVDTAPVVRQGAPQNAFDYPNKVRIDKLINHSSSAGITATDLEGANSRNLPFIQFAANYDSTNESPLVSATYTTHCENFCASIYSPITGSLLASPRQSSGVVYYDLPLSKDVLGIESIGQLGGDIRVTVTLTDAVGHSTSHDYWVVYTVQPLPIVVKEDTAYKNAGDRSSTFMYNPRSTDWSDKFYSGLSSSQWIDGNVRLARYIVYNPNSFPVAFTYSLSGGSYKLSETWATNAQPLNSNALYTENWSGTHTFLGTETWGPQCSLAYADPCGSISLQWKLHRNHNVTAADPGFNCMAFQTENFPVSHVPAPITVASSTSALKIMPYANPLASGGEVQAPNRVDIDPSNPGTTFAVQLPGVSGGGTTPTATVLYVVRPASLATPSTNRSSSWGANNAPDSQLETALPQLVFQTVSKDGSSPTTIFNSVTGYAHWMEDWWVQGTAHVACTSGTGQAYQYAGNRAMRLLTQADDTFSYDLYVLSYVLNGSGSYIATGEPATANPFQVNSVSKVITHQ